MKKRVIYEENGEVSVVNEPIPEVEDEEKLEKWRKEQVRMEKLRQITNEAGFLMTQSLSMLNIFPNQGMKENIERPMTSATTKELVEFHGTKKDDLKPTTLEVYNFAFPFGKWSVRTTNASFRSSLTSRNQRSKRILDEEDNNGYKKDQSFAHHCGQRLYKVLEKLLTLEDDVWSPLPP
jgi:hypothetical protein